jgi:hypothetical protein
MTTHTISINRAPVLTLWAAVVAERLGFDYKEALSLGRAVAGLNAQSKGRRLGVYKPREEKSRQERGKEPKDRVWVEVLGRSVPARKTAEGLRALRKDQVIDPDGTRRYLEQRFGDELPAARAAMKRLARAYRPKELARQAYALYERFRPSVPEGRSGWGARGELDLGVIEELARERKP